MPAPEDDDDDEEEDADDEEEPAYQAPGATRRRRLLLSTGLTHADSRLATVAAFSRAHGQNTKKRSCEIDRQSNAMLSKCRGRQSREEKQEAKVKP